VTRPEMFRAFNMGVGMVVLTNSANVDAVIGSARDAGITAWTLGRVTRGSGQVLLD
jgi:phosphoribosylformylglycinamidine cyclo-ligase